MVDSNGNKFDNLNPIFEFIKNHKQKNDNGDNDDDNIGEYLKLIYWFVIFEFIKTCCVEDFLTVMQFDFKNQDTYKKFKQEDFRRTLSILICCLKKDKNSQHKAAVVIEDIFNYAPDNLLQSGNICRLLRCFKENCVNIVIDGKRINKLYENIGRRSFCHWVMLLSCCKDHSVHQNIFNEVIVKEQDGQNIRKWRETSLLPFEGKHLYLEFRHEQYMFTPSIIDFIKQKLCPSKNYDLENDPKKNFECGNDGNFVEGNNCDLGTIFYRLRFENYMLIPHTKEHVIKLFESTKSFFPEKYEIFNDYHDDGSSTKYKFDFELSNRSQHQTNKIYEEMDEFVKQIFIEKGVIQKNEGNNNEIALENQIDNNYNTKLTLEELKTILLSNFKFGDYGIAKQKFETLIPDKIDNEYYFRWILEFYKCTDDQDEISKEDFIFCVKRYKFIDHKDFNDFCDYIGRFVAYDKIKFDVDCVNALLDTYTDELNVLRDYSSNKSYAYDYMEKVVSKIQSQGLADKINNKFNIPDMYKLKVKSKAIEILLTSGDNNQFNMPVENFDSNKCAINSQQKQSKTPLWLIIITLGAIFWGPWLFKKIFGDCCNFGCGDVIVDYDENQESSNPNSKSKQDNNLEENLNNRGN